MSWDPTRLIRLRWSGPAAARPDRAAPSTSTAPRGAPRFLGQVIDRGARPTLGGRVVLVHPARLDGPEAEGAVPAISVDTTRVIPVVAVGAAAPAVGDLVVAVAAGGRWLTSAAAAASSHPCTPCAIPRKNLTLSWTNNILGPGSATLVYTPPSQWVSVCTHHVVYSLSCPGSAVRFAVDYFLDGSCPTGTRQACSSDGTPPLALTLEASACDPFYLRYSVDGPHCMVLSAHGYFSFTVTE